MTREECEQFICNKLKEIREVYSKYNPNGHYLTMSVIDTSISANNEYYDADAEKPIDFYVVINEKDNEEDDTVGDDSLLDDQELYPEDYDWEDWKERD